MRTITIKMEKSLAGHLEHLAHAQEISVSEVVRRMVRASSIAGMTRQAQRSEELVDPVEAAEWDTWASQARGSVQA